MAPSCGHNLTAGRMRPSMDGIPLYYSAAGTYRISSTQPAATFSCSFNRGQRLAEETEGSLELADAVQQRHHAGFLDALDCFHDR